MRRGLSLIALATVLLIAGCGPREAPLPAGLQNIRGQLRRADISLTRRGTHELVQNDVAVYLVESPTVNLHQLEGKEVELQGMLERNSDPAALPVLVVTSIVGGQAESMRAWSIPGLGISFEAPRSWTGDIANSVAQFTVSGSTVPVLRVLREETTALPFNFRSLSASDTELKLTPVGRYAQRRRGREREARHVHDLHRSVRLLLCAQRQWPGPRIHLQALHGDRRGTGP